jgi:peptidoglycan glycosyltransferase/penicillin-binding protein 2
VDLEQPFHCSGSYVFNEQLSISCWKEEGHGDIDFSEAFALSCNPSFIEVGLRLGREHLLKYVDKLHLIDPGITGYKNIYASHVSINPGKAALGNACLEQQGVKVSPVQLASLISTIADDGCWRPPSLLRYTINEKGQKHLPELENKKPLISSETARKMQRLMEKVVSEGTGKTAALSETRVAGKTATSQTGNLNEDGEEILNAWFGGFFPAENPRWAVVVMVEDGKSGSQDAAPVFRDIARSMLNCY